MLNLSIDRCLEKHAPSASDQQLADLSHKQKLTAYFDLMAPIRDRWRKKAAFYHAQLETYLRGIIPEGASVLEIGCGTGDLLNAMRPSRGMGIDISSEMVKIAQAKHPHLQFEVEDVENLQLSETFDYVVMTGVIGHLEDIQSAFQNLRKVCRPDTRVVVVYYNYLWEPLVKMAEAIGAKLPEFTQHWLPLEDIENLLGLNDFEVIKKRYHLLMPVNIPLVSKFANKILAHLPFFWKLSINEVIVARPVLKEADVRDYTCSVVVPCRNERGHIESIVNRIPEMGTHTEIVFVEGGSQDGTADEIRRVINFYPEKDIAFLTQDGKGKGDAVRKGFDHASGEILMIQDADMTAPPEDLPKFYHALASGKGEFINGSRLVYQMEDGAMRFLNLLGNKFFSRAFTYLLEQRIRDTLCGTKVISKKDYEKIVANRKFFGEFDPFGDFDLLFGAAKLNLKIAEIPVRYRSRAYGATQISRFSHGWLLLKMVFFAMTKIKFV